MVAKTSSDPRLILRFGDNADVSIVSRFIEEHWQQGHILSRDRELFEYMFLERDGRLNFVIAFDPQSNEVIAILGYIPSDTFHSRISLSMWKARPDAHLRKYKAGLAVLRFLIDELKPKSIFSTGISANTRDVYKFLGYSCDVMNHHVIVNNELEEFRIIKNPPQISFEFVTSEIMLSSLTTISTNEELRNDVANLDFSATLKDIDYLCHRYIDHPRFKYEVRSVRLDKKTIGILVFRRSYANDRSCIRIIDIMGEEICLSSATRLLVQEMLENGDEYIDLLSWGLDSKQINGIGFTDVHDFADCVVPEYFSPFSQTNVDRFLFTNLPETEIFYKGDGDQDRPN
ncbi:MAG: hypothetical protein NT119_04030 [Actinobacteria bacterium]|nr:hypothetical protein [Actinomycetota bacterium]